MNEVICVGLSNKKGKLPLDSSTNSGKLIDKLEEQLKDKFEYNVYKTNMVNYAPLDNNGKLRYPNKEEMEIGCKNLFNTIKSINPKIVVLLGSSVCDQVEKYLKIKLEPINFKKDFTYYPILHNGIYYIKIQHPSFIYRFKRKYIDDYINGIIKSISKL